MNNSSSSSPTQDERLMAALSHFTVLLPFIGLLAPIIIWVTQKEKSRYVAFQALQALGLQLIMIVASFIGMFCYLISFLVAFLSEAEMSQPSTDISFIAFFVVIGIILIGGLALIVYGITGAFYTFQGKAFRYILIGNWVERFIQPKDT